MKILHIYAQKPGFTGSGYYLKNILEEGKKKSFTQSAIIGIEEKNKDKYNLSGCSKIYPVCFSSQKLPFPVVGMSDQMPYKSTLYKNLKGEKFYKWKKQFKNKIQEAIENFKPDLVISHHLWLLSALSTNFTNNIKHIVICHGTGLRKYKQIKKHRNTIKNSLSKVDKIIALNFQQKEEINKLMKINKNMITVVGNGFNSELFFPLKNKNHKKETINLLYAGKISKAKGLLALLKSYSELKENYNINLTLCGGGNGKEFTEIKNLASEIDKNINFSGIIKQNKLAEKMRKSDIFILPSYYEGLPLVIIEALASGLRVVTTDLPGIKEWLGPEINENNIIEFVKPPLCGEDCLPYSDQIPAFIGRLSLKLEKQIISVKNSKKIDHQQVKKNISKKSWSSILNNLISTVDL